MDGSKSFPLKAVSPPSCPECKHEIIRRKITIHVLNHIKPTHGCQRLKGKLFKMGHSMLFHLIDSVLWSWGRGEKNGLEQEISREDSQVLLTRLICL